MKRLALRCAFFTTLLLGCSSGSEATATGIPPVAAQGAAPVAPADAAPACSSIAAATETFRVKNDFGTIEGTLEVREGCGSMPVVVIVPGSGVTDRDGNVPGDTANPAIYRVLAETIRDAGFAVLRTDDPMVGKSTSAGPRRVEDFRFEMEIADQALIVRELRKDQRFGAIVAAGHSQGSLTAILAAQQEPIDGFVSLAGAGRPVSKILHEQWAPKLTKEQVVKLDAALAKLENGELVGPQEEPLDRALPVYFQPYLISWIKYDPKREIGTLPAKTLILQGRMDLQIAELDAQLLVQAKPDAKVALVDDMGHYRSSSG